MAEYEFKVGDRVQFKEWDEMVKEYRTTSIPFTRSMKPLCGTLATIAQIYSDKTIKLKDFEVDGWASSYEYTTDMIKPMTKEKQKSKFKIGDRVKIVNTQKTCNHLNGTYGTISDLFLSSDCNYYYELDNLSFESHKGKHKCLYAFIESELEFASTKKININKKNDTFTNTYEPYAPNKTVEPIKEAFGFKHGDLVKSADLPSPVSKHTICRVVGYVCSFLIIEIPNYNKAHDGKLICGETRWEHFSGNKYWFAAPEDLTLISPSEISKTIVSHEIEGNKTIVTLSDGSIGTAKCNPEDKFDAYIGLKLAAERAYGMKIDNEPVPKFEIGKKYIMTGESQQKGDILQITDCVNTKYGLKYFFEVVKGEPYPCDHFYETSYIERSLKPYEEPKVKEVKRKAKVGEYIKIVNKIQPFCNHKNGDILKVIVLNPTTVIAKDIPIQIRHEEYVVLENYKPEGNEKPKLKFKEGDCVFVRNATNGCQGANGYRGRVTNLEATNGLLKFCVLDTTNVHLDNGEIWRVNTDGLELVK